MGRGIQGGGSQEVNRRTYVSSLRGNKEMELKGNSNGGENGKNKF